MATIRKRGNSYQIRVSCGYDTSGNQVVQTMTWKPADGMNKKQIEKELQKQAILFEDKCMKGQVTANIKFQDFAEQWFEEYAKLNLRNTSYERMKQLTVRVYPAIGHLRLDKITSRHIQQFINDLALNGKSLKNGRPLSRKTAVHHLSFISDVFSYAVKTEMLTDNPCKRVTVPKGEKKEKDIYTLEEVAQLFQLLETAPLKYRTFFTLAIYSGFRRGEMLGLEWKDIDWEHNVISVRRTSNYTASKGIYTDTTKTKKSQRSLKFPQSVMDLLREYKAEQDEEREKLGTKWQDYDRLFVKWDGRPMNNNTPYEIKALNAEMAQVESELAEKQAKREDLDQQIEQKTAQVKTILNYIPDYEKEFKIEDECDQLRRELIGLLDGKLSIMKHKDAIIAKVQRLCKLVKKVNDNAYKSGNTIYSLHEKLDAAMKEYDDVCQRWKCAAEERTELRRDNAELSAEVDDLTEFVSLLKRLEPQKYAEVRQAQEYVHSQREQEVQQSATRKKKSWGLE